ncbi:MAG TPA: glycosyltransferase [Victivallales bacterium]|nr:glycosyltransferase [Victivallales bacterium]
MKILYAIDLYHPYYGGGGSELTKILAENFCLKGNDVGVITTSPRSKTSKEGFTIEKINGITVYRYFPSNLYWCGNSVGQNKIKKLLWHLKDMHNISSGIMLNKIFNEFKPDILHSHCTTSFSPIIWKVAKKKSIPIVHTAHAYHLMCVNSNLLKKKKSVCNDTNSSCKCYRWWYKRQIKNVDIFCSPSNFLINKFYENKYLFNKTKVIANGIDLSELNKIKDKNDSVFKLLYIGSLSKIKGIQILIDSLHYLKPNSYQLHIAGTGEFKDDIKQLTKNNSNIFFHGLVSGKEKKELFSIVNALVLPSICFENQPMSIIEAFYYGLPVIGSNIGGIRELLENISYKLLFEVGDAEDLADKMKYLIANPEYYNEISKKVVEKARNYNILESIAEYEKTYEQLLDYSCE